MAIDLDFLHLEDSRREDFDGYGERLQLSLRAIPQLRPGEPLAIRATLLLDGRAMPVVAFPDDPMESHERIGTAIAAAVVIKDVSQDLDRLGTFALRQQTALEFGGSTSLDLPAGSYAVRVVARTPHPRFPARGASVRVAKRILTVGGGIEQDGLDAVWLAEYLGPRQSSRSIRVRLRHFGPEGERASVDEVVMAQAERLPLNSPFEKRAISVVPDSEENLHFLSPLDNGRCQLFEAKSDGGLTFVTSAFNFDSQIFAKSQSFEAWVWDGRRIGRYFLDSLVRAFDAYVDVQVLSGVRDSTFWTICGLRGQGGAGTVYLRRIDENGMQIAENRTVAPSSGSAETMLRTMADGGVMAYADHRGAGPHVLRVGPDGRVLASSESFPSNVVDFAVNPFSGEALLVHAEQGRRAEVIRLDAGLRRTQTLKPGDAVFGGAFEAFHSAELSAPPEGQRLWLAGERRERQPSGTFEIRGAVGYLDQDGDFTLVQGGMQRPGLLRALW